MKPNRDLLPIKSNYPCTGKIELDAQDLVTYYYFRNLFLKK